MALQSPLTESYWPATDDGLPLAEMTVGQMLREAARSLRKVLPQRLRHRRERVA